jgi:prevent-host-death family protein
MDRKVSVRDLRNRTPDVVRAVEAGETLTLTVNGRAVADIVPHRSRSERVPADILLAELARLSGGPGSPWPEIDVTTDEPVTGVDAGA